MAEVERLQQSRSQLGAEGVLGCCAGLGLQAGKSEGTGGLQGSRSSQSRREMQNCLEQRTDETWGEKERRAWIML